MANSAFKTRLKKMQTAFKSAEAATGPGQTNVEPGKYAATVTGATLKEIGGNLNIEWEYTVSDGDFEGEKITNLDGIRDEGMPYLKKKLNMFGYDADTVDLAEDLETILGEIVEAGQTVQITVKKNDDYTNVYLNKVEDAEEGDGEEVEEEEEEEETEETEEEEVSFAKGDKVLYKKKGDKKATEFVIEKIDDKNSTAKLKGLVAPIAFDLLEKVAEEVEEEEEEEQDAEETEEQMAELEKGSKVEVDINGKKAAGVVISIDEDDETAKVKLDKTKKIVKVSFDQIELV